MREREREDTTKREDGEEWRGEHVHKESTVHIGVLLGHELEESFLVQLQESIHIESTMLREGDGRYHRKSRTRSHHTS
jgi:hypothetical protein